MSVDAETLRADLVVCAVCGEPARRSSCWERFSLLRKVGAKGGGRQKTCAGHATGELVCDPCARTEDLERKRGAGYSPPDRLPL